MTEITGNTGQRTARRVSSLSSPQQTRTGCQGVDEAGDQRFRVLVGHDAWMSLEPAVRRRFSQPCSQERPRIFSGKVVVLAHSRAGRWLAWATRPLGGPVPDPAGAPGPSTVVVTSDDRLGGQIWSRTYARPGRLPQTVNSVKRFRGPTGLEEYLGRGLVMTLTLTAEDGALVFRSAGYAIEVAGRRVSLPRVLAPGACTITHRDCGAGCFSFTLDLTHPWFGRLVHQFAVYEEIAL